MNVSRASFLKICGAAALGQGVDAGPWITGFVAGSGGEASAAATPSAGRLLLQDACAARFRPHVNTAFTVQSIAEGPVRLVLARVVDGPCAGGVEQFSLIFHGPADADALHATHAFQHPALGAFDLFIAPVGASNARRTVYEACFSRHVSSAHRDSGRVPTTRTEDDRCRTSS